MNLLKKMQKEVELLNLTDKLTIARFLYIRTGELFDYDETFFTYCTGGKKQKKIFYNEIDINDVQYFRWVCASWARMYVKLLNAFNISGEYIEDSTILHAYVKFYIENKTYIADITYHFQDNVNIKFGLQTSYFYRNTFFNLLLKRLYSHKAIEKRVSDFLEMDKIIKYYKGIYTDEVLAMIKKEIYATHYKDKSQLIERVFETVMLIINIERPDVNFFSGSMFISRMLEYFLGKLNAYIRYSDVYDKKRLEFMEVIANTYEDEAQFFLYEKNEDGYFKLREVSKKQIIKLKDNYKCEHKEVLRLAK